jgi:hypothetical protein
METVTKERRPPYVPYQTFAGFLTDHKDGLPNRLDSKILEKVGGSLRAQLLGALKFLTLIDDVKNVSPELHRLVQLEGNDRKKLLAETIRKSYSFIFNDEFDLAKTSESQFRHQFELSGATNDVLRKSITFFLLACQDADIPYSPFITGPSRRAAAKTSRSGRKGRSMSKKIPAADGNGQHEDQEDEQPNPQAVMDELLDLFTKINPWPKAQREIVLRHNEKLIALIRARS